MPFLPYLAHLTIKEVPNRGVERHGKGQILPEGAKWLGVGKFDPELKVDWENINLYILSVTHWPLQCFEMESSFQSLPLVFPWGKVVWSLLSKPLSVKINKHSVNGVPDVSLYHNMFLSHKSWLWQVYDDALC